MRHQNITFFSTIPNTKKVFILQLENNLEVNN